MTVLRAAERPLAPGLSPAAPSAAVGTTAVFLHAGWRSCGTWLWATLRADPGVRAFYEPLHEDFDRLDLSAIGAFSPDSWGSGHGPDAPYFAEFAALLNRRGTGVEGYRQSFAFDDYFAGAHHEAPALQAYLQGLLNSGQAEGRLPVLKLARSQGRVAWMERHFPDALHAVVLRDPVAQWRSARAQLERDGNRYFILAPYMIIARNAGHALLASALAHLQVRLPPVVGPSLDVTRDACWYHVKNLSWAERYRGFLAFWAASSLASLSGAALVIDADALSEDADHRAAVEAVLRASTCLPVALRPRAGAGEQESGTAAERRDAIQAAAAAVDFVSAHAHLLAPERAAALRAKMAPAAVGDDPVRAAYGSISPSRYAHAAAAAYVAATRVLHPLRRAHFHLDQWQRK